MFSAFRSFFGAASFNAVMPQARIYLRLRFRDPDGVIRNFPTALPVRVRFVEASAIQVVNTTLEPGGILSVEARTAAPWRSFTLEFDPGYFAYITCEAYGSPPLSPPLLQSPPMGAWTASPPNKQRFFCLPKKWEMRQADWSPPVFAGNGAWNSPPGHISHTVTPAADIGSAASPPAITLNPNWKYLQFQFYDRFYGHGLINSPPGSGHQRRISIPQISLEGYWNDPNATRSPPTHSNWVVDGGAPADLTQAIPWIIRRAADGTASPPLTGSSVDIRFKTHAALVSSVYSPRQAVRELRDLSPPASPPSSPPSPLQPGPERLRYYDLPRLWKSRNYFARNVPNSPPAASPPAGQFFNDLNAADLAVSNTKATPLQFSLDDIVFTNASLNKLDLGANDRIALFHHRFADRHVSPPAAAAQFPDVNMEGIFRAGPDASPPGYPYSTGGRRNLYYVTDYPDWTRLIMAQGNLWDVFGHRTDSPPVFGARAAVRWIDATAAPNGFPIGTHPPAPPRLRQQTYFSIQPFYEKRYLRHSINPQLPPMNKDEEISPPYGTDDYPIGRTDLAFLRCCDRYDSDEVAVVFRYMKLALNFASPPVSASPPADKRAFAARFVDLVARRFNGPDSVMIGMAPHVLNAQRPWIIPSPPGSPPLRAHITTMVQYVPRAWAHYEVVPMPEFDPITGNRNRSWMQGWDGTGQLRVQAATHISTGGWNSLPGRGLVTAHESGHALSTQDEYREAEADSKNWKHLHIMGNPYIADDWALMFNNWDCRGRYFWYCTEWMRHLSGLGTPVLKINNGPSEPDYHVPPYPHTKVRPGRDYVSHPVRLNLRTPAAGSTNNCDALLYFLGADTFANSVLPSLGTPPLGGGTIDGMLIMPLRIRLNIRNVPGGVAVEKVVRTHLFSEVAKQLEGKLNYKRTASFQTTAAGTHRFNRCLLHFIPGFAADLTSPPGSSPFGRTAPADMAINVPHIVVDLVRPPVPALAPAPSPPWPHQSPPASPPYSPPLSPPVWRNSPPPANRLVRFNVPANLNTLPVPDRTAFLNALALEIAKYCFQTLGLTAENPPVAGDVNLAASYQHLVRSVMDAAAPPPNLF